MLLAQRRARPFGELLLYFDLYARIHNGTDHPVKPAIARFKHPHREGRACPGTACDDDITARVLIKEGNLQAFPILCEVTLGARRRSVLLTESGPFQLAYELWRVLRPGEKVDVLVLAGRMA